MSRDYDNMDSQTSRGGNDMESRYEVYQREDGKLYLAILDEDGTPVFVGSGYEDESGSLREDIEYIGTHEDPGEWTGNLLKVDTTIYKRFQQKYYEVIATEGQMYIEDMCQNALDQLVRGTHVSFSYEGRRHIGVKIEDLNHYYAENQISYNAMLYNVVLSGIPAGDIYADSLTNI